MNLTEIQKDIDITVDKLGMTIDSKIKNFVILLNYHGVETTGSCQGHSNWGCSYPWVDIKYESTDILIELLHEFKHKAGINLMFLKDGISEEFKITRITPDVKKIRRGRFLFKLFEEFLENKI